MRKLWWSMMGLSLTTALVTACSPDGPVAPPVTRADIAAARESADTAGAQHAAIVAAQLAPGVQLTQSPVANAAPAAVVARVSTSSPFGIAARPDGLVLVSNARTDYITFIDGNTFTVLDSMAVDDTPNPLGFSPDGLTAYVGSQTARTLQFVDVNSRTVVGSISTGTGAPISLLVSPDGRFCFVGTHKGSVLMVNTATRKIVRTIKLAGQMNGLAMDSTGTRLYATNSHSTIGSLYEISGPNFEVVRTYIVGSIPQGVAISRDGTRAIVANEGSYLSDVDLATGATTNYPTGGGSFGVTDAPRFALAFTTQPAIATLLQYDLTTHAMSPPFVTQTQPRRLAWLDATRTLVVTEYAQGTVAFLR